MSVSKYAYSPSKCDGEPCPGDCDLCSLANETTFVDAVEELMEEPWFKGDSIQRQKITDISKDPMFSIEDVILALWMCSINITYSEITDALYKKGW